MCDLLEGEFRGEDFQGVFIAAVPSACAHSESDWVVKVLSCC